MWLITRIINRLINWLIKSGHHTITHIDKTFSDFYDAAFSVSVMDDFFKVELLWRRAEGDARNGRHGKIYCLVHAELLDYDVARKAEQSLDKHSHAAEGTKLK